MEMEKQDLMDRLYQLAGNCKMKYEEGYLEIQFVMMYEGLGCFIIVASDKGLDLMNEETRKEIVMKAILRIVVNCLNINHPCIKEKENALAFSNRGHGLGAAYIEDAYMLMMKKMYFDDVELKELLYDKK